MVVARPLGFEIDFVNPISGSPAWFVVIILKFILHSFLKSKFMKKKNSLTPKKFYFRSPIFINQYIFKFTLLKKLQRIAFSKEFRSELMLSVLGQGFARWFGQLGVFSKKHIHKVVEIFILLFSPRFPECIYQKKNLSKKCLLREKYSKYN